MENSVKGWHWNKDSCYAAVKYNNDGNIVSEDRREYVVQAHLLFDNIRLGCGEKKVLAEVHKDGTMTELRKFEREC